MCPDIRLALRKRDKMRRKATKTIGHQQPELFTEQPTRWSAVDPPKRARARRSRERRSVGRPVWMTQREYTFLQLKAKKAGYSFSRFLVVAGMRYRVRASAHIPTLENIVDELEPEAE